MYMYISHIQPPFYVHNVHNPLFVQAQPTAVRLDQTRLIANCRIHLCSMFRPARPTAVPLEWTFGHLGVIFQVTRQTTFPLGRTSVQ